jgi:aminoglycoside 6'-N-acetyltransferase
LTHPVLHGTRVTLRPLRDGDSARLHEIRSEPDVARWWGLPGAEVSGVAAHDDDEIVLAIEYRGNLVGAIQYHEESDPDYRHASVDIYLSTRVQGRGVGRDAIRTLARYLFDERGHHRLTIDPAATNARAVAAYASVGFRPVGVMRQYERGPDGTWHNGLLMDLLRDELRSADTTEQATEAPAGGR